MKCTNYLSILSFALSIFVVVYVLKFNICPCTLQKSYDGGNVIETGLHGKDVPVKIEANKHISALIAHYEGADSIKGAIFDVRPHNARGRISLAENNKIEDYPSNHSQFSILHNGKKPGWSLVTNGDNVTFNLRDWTGKYEEPSDSIEGKVGVGTFNPTSKLDVNGKNGYNQIRMRKPFDPPPKKSSDARGNIGDLAWDDNYIYIKTNFGWKRSKLSW